MKAYVLVKVAMGHLEDVAAAVRKMPGVISADPTFGEYDVIVVAEMENMRDLGVLLGQGIQTTQGVLETHTCTAFE
jgi:DNA-binding Lrp family transcriptional regulator